MWSTRDNDASLIAAEVYPRLVCGSAPDSTMAGHALHHAVKRLCEKGPCIPAFLSWVPLGSKRPYRISYVMIFCGRYDEK